MPSVAELERELDKQRRKVDSKRDRRNHFRDLAGDKSAQIHDLRDRAGEARDERDENRKTLVVIRDRLESIEADGVAADEVERFERLSVRQEALVDENEELTALLHRVLPNIAEQTKRREEVRDLRERFGDDLEHAVQRKARLKKALKEAREDAASNPLGTEHFVVAEFDCNDGTPVPSAAIPALREWVWDIGLDVRSRFGSVHCNSGFRHAAYNRAIGGEPNSVHIYDYPGRAGKAVAVDFICGSGSATEWFLFTAGRADGRGHYPGRFHHADNRNNIGWPDAVWSG